MFSTNINNNSVTDLKLNISVDNILLDEHLIWELIFRKPSSSKFQMITICQSLISL